MKILRSMLLFITLVALPCAAQQTLTIKLVKAEISQNNRSILMVVNIIDPTKDSDPEKPGIQPTVVYVYGPHNWGRMRIKGEPDESVPSFKARVLREVQAIVKEKRDKLSGKQKDILNEMLEIEAPPDGILF